MKFLWKIIGSFDIVTSALALTYLIWLNSIEELFDIFLRVGLFIYTVIGIIIELPILVVGILLVLKEGRLRKSFALGVAIVQIVIILFIFIPDKQSFFEFESGSSAFGFDSKSKIGLGLFKRDYKAPSVSFQNPVNNFCRLKGICKPLSGENVTIKLDISDDVAIKTVEIYIDDSLIKTFEAGPFEFVWDSTVASNGGHQFKVLASDKAGNITTLETNLRVEN